MFYSFGRKASFFYIFFDTKYLSCSILFSLKINRRNTLQPHQILSAALLLLRIPGCAEDNLGECYDCQEVENKKEYSYEPQEIGNKEECSEAYCIENCATSLPICKTFFAFGDFLYWKAGVTGFPYAVPAVIEQLDFISFANDETIKEVTFNYDPGFRVGVGLQFDCEWDFLAKWTRFHTKGSQKAKRSKRPY